MKLLIEDFFLNFKSFGPKNYINNSYLNDGLKEELYEIESPRKLVKIICDLMGKTDEFAFRSFILLKENNKFTPEEIEQGKKQYLTRKKYLKEVVENIAQIYNAAVSFPEFSDVESKYADYFKDHNISDETSKKQEENIKKQLDSVENPEGKKTEKKEEDPAEVFKKIRSIRKYFRGLRDFFNTPVGSIIMDMIVHGPGMANDVNIIRALYKQFILADHVEFSQEDLKGMAQLIQSSEKFRKEVNKTLRYYGNQSYDKKVGGFLNNYTKGINTGGYSYKDIAERIKNFHNERNLDDLKKTCPEYQNIIRIFNPCYIILSFKSLREIITNAFNKNSISSIYVHFFPQILDIGNEDTDDLTKFRNFVGLYFASRNKTKSDSIYNALHMVLHEGYFFDKIVNEYKDLRQKQTGIKEKPEEESSEDDVTSEE